MHFLTLFLLFFLSACSLFSEPKVEEIPIIEDQVVEEFVESEERIFFREELGIAREEIISDLREMILEEIIPEIWVNQKKQEVKEIKDSQKRALTSAKEKTFLGRVEWVSFKDPEFSVQARVDTGAKTSSLHAENIKELQINGEPFVQFETMDDDSNKHTMVHRVVATTKVKNTSGKITQRYVIRLPIVIGGVTHNINVNLNDRKSMHYNFLVGRNLLLGNYLVDVSESHILGDKKL